MCGRYFIEPESGSEELRGIYGELNERFAGSAALASLKRGEMRPSDAVSALVLRRGEIAADIMLWGLPRQGGGLIINVRAETAAQKFYAPLAQRRVVIPATGFYEWRRLVGKAKDRFLFRADGEKELCFAGIYDIQAGGLPRFAILTTVANGSVCEYHDRMPVLLDWTERLDWLDGSGVQGILERVPAALTTVRADEGGREEQTTIF